MSIKIVVTEGEPSSVIALWTNLCAQIEASSEKLSFSDVYIESDPENPFMSWSDQDPIITDDSSEYREDCYYELKVHNGSVVVHFSGGGEYVPVKTLSDIKRVMNKVRRDVMRYGLET